MTNRDPLLSIEEFLKRRNNFHLYFAKEFLGEAMRTQKPFVLCMLMHREKFETLTSTLGCLSEADPFHASTEFLEKLYEAYAMMHPYAESNEKLFR